MFEMRDGEVRLADDPAMLDPDGHLVFIGRVLSPWMAREDCPKNMRAARETSQPAALLIDEPYRPGLTGLERANHIHVLTWMHHAPRNLIVQKPRHATEAKGVFALRSPARPNPVGLHSVRLVSLDIAAGRLEIETIDALDGTPIIDIKPYFPSVDVLADALMPDRGER
ncbi:MULTISPECIES: tRNA (N6-threonylcarbamoyladenosine(37)-N6)-methyltransferase TrmO [Phyllobacteriaceae]|jgi:tRNA-Thr(GGU) m(6)t(6)A37 methyltransferase TsaA|uniref:tRNA-Thr(GGU) m(6)t(6)A37 methyltransferase TsaA n=1 Tax=Mesorhizobium hungaricum TaxID=1566387 RepID=A0A1C2DYF5_9HYPH|nr:MULTISPECIES: tRNA (N6-threonylcarbamoyladenosine(37)-N6)-methyltransferase TrmO [Mesorhizobium]MBN9234789.1 tRNA (N6-threonylcarbamoyladenosine(37)-N6)-methyltransferase TrmO [Mesorhizobium sp.]MDQ0328730.1 tRNA-Thr(GGU) m(6)t(6)A37 methyltransferase TsaA [Mesorhizobium sp. YL-MeA3-2017]OCX19800.1 tRNA-Thr(GGU) m(6)t(6)A37 methyltransferase TsaA [Mesorhizobium hungaricum]